MTDYGEKALLRLMGKVLPLLRAVGVDEIYFTIYEQHDDFNTLAQEEPEWFDKHGDYILLPEVLDLQVRTLGDLVMIEYGAGEYRLLVQSGKLSKIGDTYLPPPEVRIERYKTPQELLGEQDLQ